MTTKVERVECHSATCEVTLKAADDVELRKSNILFQAISNASLVASAGPVAGLGATARYHLAYDSAMRDPEANENVYPQRRRHMLSQLRQAMAAAPKEALRDFPPLPEN